MGVKSRILSIYDVTQLPHNGCRLPKKRRVQIVRNILESAFGIEKTRKNSGKNLTRKVVPTN